MAKQLLLDRSLYYSSSVVLIRGDRWNIKCRVVDNIGGVIQDVDLTGAGATGYFPAATGGTIPVVASISNPTAGELILSVPPDVSEETEVNVIGIAPYVGVSGADIGPYTVQTTDSPVVIADPGFELII